MLVGRRQDATHAPMCAEHGRIAKPAGRRSAPDCHWTSVPANSIVPAHRSTQQATRTLGEHIMNWIRAAVGATLLLAFAAPASAQQGTLATVKQRGHLICGGHIGAPGFSQPDSKGDYSGFDADLCRAVAAAIFGDAHAIRFRMLTSQQRLTALQTGEIDVLIRTTTWTMGRDVGTGLNVTNTTYYDGQGFLVRKKLGNQHAKELNGATICITTGTTNELNLADWARSNNLRVQPLVIEQNDETIRAYDSGRCDAMSTAASQLAGIRTTLANPDDHLVPPEIISK